MNTIPTIQTTCENNNMLDPHTQRSVNTVKIVDVDPFFYPHYGGIEHRMHDTSKLLAERGHDVTILTGQLPGTPEEEESNGYKILRLRSRLINIYNPPFISSKGVLEAIQSMDPDIVNYNYRWAPSYNKDLKRYDGKKVFTYHNMWGEGIGFQATLSEINDNFFRKILETFDHIICVSDFVKNDLVRRGIDPLTLTTVPTCLNSFPEMTQTEGDYILSLGRLVKTKGLSDLIEAMRYVDEKLIICGTGPEEKHLRKLIEKNDLSDKIEMKGWVSEEEKIDLMSKCKLFVMPSLFESFGLAALELMSFGRPIVCTDVNGLPDTVGDGGIITKTKDPKGLADAINDLLQNKEKRIELGKNARVQAEKYNWPENITKIEDVYRNVIDGVYRRPQN